MNLLDLPHDCLIDILLKVGVADLYSFEKASEKMTEYTGEAWHRLAKSIDCVYDPRFKRENFSSDRRFVIENYRFFDPTFSFSSTPHKEDAEDLDDICMMMRETTAIPILQKFFKQKSLDNDYGYGCLQRTVNYYGGPVSFSCNYGANPYAKPQNMNIILVTCALTGTVEQAESYLVGQCYDFRGATPPRPRDVVPPPVESRAIIVAELSDNEEYRAMVQRFSAQNNMPFMFVSVERNIGVDALFRLAADHHFFITRHKTRSPKYHPAVVAATPKGYRCPESKPTASKPKQPLRAPEKGVH